MTDLRLLKAVIQKPHYLMNDLKTQWLHDKKILGFGYLNFACERPGEYVFKNIERVTKGL
jgi:hypothetical protein